MKIRILILFIVLLESQVNGQWVNLVPNYSFENVKSGYYTYGNNYYCEGPPYSKTVAYWNNIYDWTHPLKAHWWCAGFPVVGTANVLPNHQRSGTYGGNGTESEFLVVPLKYNGLKIGKTYYVEVFHNGTQPSGVHFSNGQPRQCTSGKLKAPAGNGLLINPFNAQQGEDWIRTREYVTGLGMDWMTLGSNGDSGDGKGGGDWDDIRIYEVQPNKCRTNWYFDNTVFNYPMEVFQASNNIYIGNGVDPENGTNHIAGDVIQYASSSVVLRAGNQIIIEQGTFIEGDQTKVFKISPEPCSDNLCPDELEFENQILCSESTKKIGTEGNEWGTTVHWSPSTYLDNPNIANPTFYFARRSWSHYL